MRLSDRKAYVLQAAYYHTIRSVTPRSEEGLETLTNSIKEFAKEASAGNVTLPLDEFFRRAAGQSHKRAQLGLAPGALTDEVSGVIGAVEAAANNLSCALCARGAICSGTIELDDAIVSEGGACIADIQRAFEQALQLTRQAYQPFVNPRRMTGVRVELSTEGLQERPGSIPGVELAANALTAYDDGEDGEDGESKVSVVVVQVAPLHVNRETCAALSYLLMHEVFCHVYQMADSAHPRRNKRGVADPLSEGMLDALAVETFRRHAEESADLLLKSDADIAIEIHLARKSLDRTNRFPEAPVVHLGTSSLEAVLALYRQDGGKEQAFRDVLRLACALNVHGWSNAERYNGMSALLTRLTARSPDLIGLLLQFRSNYNHLPIVSYLLAI